MQDQRRHGWHYCPDCGGSLRTVHVGYSADKRAQKHACTRCPYKAVSVSIIFRERPLRGSGFDAVMTQLPSFKITVTQDEEDS